MKFLKIVFLVVFFPLMTGATSAHKFYVSITKIEYVAKSESLQVITQLFIEDVEQVLQQRYDPSISLGTTKETEADGAFLEQYILQKLKIEVNGTPLVLNYLGKEYDTDMVKSYMEVTGIPSVMDIIVENKMLMDLFDEQQNIIHYKNNKTRKSLMLDRDNPKGVLNFN